MFLNWFILQYLFIYCVEPMVAINLTQNGSRLEAVYSDTNSGQMVRPAPLDSERP